MAGTLMLIKQAAASVAVAAADKVRLFINDSGRIAHKDESGNVVSYAKDFKELGDVPSSYSEQAGKIVRVKGDESGLEFAAPATDRSTVTSVSSSSGVVTLDYALGDYFTLTLTENVTSWVISNPPGSGKGFTLMVQITQDSTPRTVAKPGTTAGGAALDVSIGSGDVDVLAITSFNNGTTLRSSIGKDFS